MAHILILTDDDDVGSLKMALRDLGYSSFIAGSKEIEVQLISAERPDLILLDSTGYKTDVSDICRSLRENPATKDAPIIMLIQREEAKSLNFTAGIDDFIIKPYSPYELEARIRLALWRANKVDAEEMIKIGDLVIDLSRYEVTIKGRPIDLTLKEYELLRHLAANPGRVFTRESLLDRIWGYDYYGGMRTVDVHIRRLRAKLESGGGSFIRTVRGVGYKFDIE